MPNVLYRWKIWTASRLIQHLDSSLLRSHADVLTAVCGFAMSCWNTWHLEGSICCSKTFIYLSAFIEPSKTCKLPIPSCSLLFTSSGHRGYEFLEFWCWNLVPFLPDIGFQLLKILWSSWMFFFCLFNYAPNVLYRWKIWTAGRPIQHPDPEIDIVWRGAYDKIK